MGNNPRSLWRVLAFHVVPGIGVVSFYLLAAPLFTSFGFPRVAALLVGFVAVSIPIQLGVLRREMRRAGRRSVLEVVPFRVPMPPWLFAALFFGLFGLALAMLVLLPLSTVDEYLATRVFWWVPEEALPAVEGATPLAKPSLVLLTLILQLVIDGLVNPVVEELYFRGFLLPRLARFGWLAPVIHTALFTLAHFWQPYNYAAIFVNVLPLTLVTWWRRNIYVQMALHCVANTVGAALALYAFLR